ncbi:type IV secretion system protein VirD4 [Aequitasia blattaphilus]|uniref:Type IV secretory system conjugative DNA transfer family protein n=1 Tax=Aequitasia blattaphilus TaxID=2949332 RepID=A0ABT1E851_9FIRM|nr:type IV secretory system conjugative DNA transfer family protein [Aequitasia blattaphilus]MCP1102000.1 type IV secretory system conjugative DNA transfer family protein [Aequitasia blattaphilus]MCR8614640.1 type IV secretory system conjugative DNA transfer family protein [Aequitasia blattaphilus]
MIYKRKPPYSLYIISLILFTVFGYFLGGIHKFKEVTINNLQENFTYIVTHPLTNWWNDKSLAWIGLLFVAWIMFVSWYSTNNRNFHFDREHGSADWGDVKKINKMLADKDDQHNTIVSYNLKISDKALSNNNMVVIGSSGTFKSTAVVGPNLLLANTSNVVLDVKGELQRLYGKFLQGLGCRVLSLNLKDPWMSDRYNPFVYIRRENDVIRLITNLHESVRKPEAMSGDPFWDDGVDLYLMALFFYEWLQAKEEKRVGSMNNILELVNEESIVVDAENGITKLQLRMDKLSRVKGENYPPVRDYRKLKDGAPETVRSIVLMVNAMLKLCETADVKRIFSGNDIDLEEIGMGVGGNPKRKTVLFLVLPDNDKSYNFLISMFYTQAFDVLMRKADSLDARTLPIHVRFWMDEFYAGAKPTDPDVLLGVIRSRNISMVPILQSPAQLKVLFKNDKWETIWDNAPCVIFLGAGAKAHETHKWISESLGKATIDTRSDGVHLGKNGNANKNFQHAGRELMTPDEVRMLKRDECIIFIEGQNPIFDVKPIPFKHPMIRKVYKMKQYGEAMSAGLYDHPVRTVYNEETLEYRTITHKKAFQPLNKEEITWYEEASKKDKSIKIFNVDQEDVLYLNWDVKPRLSEDEVADLFRNSFKNSVDPSNIPDDVTNFNERTEFRHINTWDLSGTIYDCLKRYANNLSEEQIEQIVSGLESGLTDRQIKEYFILDAIKMEQFKRAFILKNKYIKNS